MPMIPTRTNLGIAVDGGGAKGLIVAQALLALEKELTADKPLIDYPGLKVLIGTSTGSIITAGIAVGMRMSDLIDLYLEAGEKVFPALVPRWVPEKLRNLIPLLIGLTRPSLFPGEPLKAIIRDYVKRFTGNPDFTLGDLRGKLRPDQALLITVMDITERRTHFLKSYQANDATWTLWEAVLATASAPSTLPVVQRNGSYWCDGGVGSFGNPSYIAARESVDWAKYNKKDVSVFSFGTGWVDAKTYEADHGAPSRWNILDWALSAPYITIADNARTQSLDIINDYMDLAQPEKGMDFRRFQVLLDRDIDPFAPAKDINAQMQKIGTAMGQQIVNNQHALGAQEGFDPEGLRSVLARDIASKAAGGAEQTAQATNA